jgi:hypothetical protein
VSDGKGNKVAVVEATKGYTFTLDASDWACVCQQHGRAWRAIGDGKGRIYIAAARPGMGTPLTLARAIMNAQPGQIVRYRDGDRLNLRKANLSSTSGDPSMPLMSRQTNTGWRPRGDSKTPRSL